MKTNIVVAAIAAVVSVIVWEAMHVITGADTTEPQKANAEFIWRKHV
jgi:hypothetical protein